MLAALGPDGQPFGKIQASFAGYLRAERNSAGVSATVDPDTIAFTLIGAVHHLFLTANGAKPDPGRVREIVSSLLGVMTDSS